MQGKYKTQRLASAATIVDLVFDTKGGYTQQASWQVMTPSDMLVSVASHPTAGVARNPGMHGKFLFIQPNAPALNQLTAMENSGKLRPLICTEFALHDIAKAHALSETGHAVGKIAIYVGQP